MVDVFGGLVEVEESEVVVAAKYERSTNPFRTEGPAWLPGVTWEEWSSAPRLEREAEEAKGKQPEYVVTQPPMDILPEELPDGMLQKLVNLVGTSDAWLWRLQAGITHQSAALYANKSKSGEYAKGDVKTPAYDRYRFGFAGRLAGSDGQVGVQFISYWWLNTGGPKTGQNKIVFQSARCWDAWTGEVNVLETQTDFDNWLVIFFPAELAARKAAAEKRAAAAAKRPAKKTAEQQLLDGGEWVG